jgi:hypothetical protein
MTYMTNNSHISNDFTIIFDGNNLNEWLMAGEGEFVAIREEKGKRRTGHYFAIRMRNGIIMVCKENVSEFYT